MSEETKDAAAPTIVPTGETVPVEPGNEPVPRITEEERAQLNEIWQETRAASNALAAMATEVKRLDAERRVVEAQSETQVMIGQQLQQRLQMKLNQLREKYNIPDGWSIDSKTGRVFQADPEEGAPQAPAASEGAAPVQTAQPA